MLNIKYRPDIDGLRAVAILSVLVYHAFPDFVRSGYIGVDIFFVISGYLITSIIIHERHRKSFSFLNFYGRRVRRLAPALLFMLLSLMLVGWFVLLPNEYQGLAKYTIASLMFVINFLYAKDLDYFDPSAELNPLLHLWSLAVEEQFYFLWPFFIILLYLIRPRYWTLAISVSVVLLFLAALSVSAVSPQLAFFLAPTRAWELALGGALAITEFQPGKHRDLLSIVGGILLAISFVVVEGSLQLQPLWLAVPVVATAFLIYAGPGALVNRVLLSNRTLVAVGLISYPLYLWHWPMLSVLEIIEGGAQSNLMRIVALAISVALAYLTWRWVEQPLRRPRSGATLMFILLSYLCVAALAWSVYSQEGVPQRVSQTVLADSASLSWPPSYRISESCTAKRRIDDLSFCLETETVSSDDQRAAIIGDSFSNQYYYGLAQEFSQAGIGLLNMGRHSCAPVRGVGQFRPAKDCSPIDSVLDHVLMDSSIQTVFLAASWSGTDSYIGVESRREFSAQLDKTVEELLRAEKDVIVIGSSPLHKLDPAMCASRPFRFGNYDLQCFVPSSKVDSRLHDEHQMLKSLVSRHPKVGYFRPTNHMCADGICPMRINGHLVYRDGHLSHIGSEHLAKSILEFYQYRQNTMSVPHD